MIRDEATRSLSYRWLIFAVLALAYFFVYFHRMCMPVVAGDIKADFQTTEKMIGLVGSLYFYLYALMQLPAGLLSDSLGPRKTVTFFLLIGGIGSIVFGYSPTVEWAITGRILVGLGFSMVFVPTMKILSQWFRAREFAQMAGILNAVGGAGVIAATWLLALMTDWFGWRASFELIGVFTLCIVGLAWLIVRDKPPGTHPGTSTQTDVNPGDAEAASQSMSFGEGMRRVLTEIRFWPLALWFFLDCGIFFAFGGLWGGPYLQHVYGMTKAEAGSILSMIAFGMIVGSPLLGIVSDRVLRSRKKIIVACSVVLALEMALLYAVPSGLPHSALYVVFFVFSVTASAIVIVAFTTTKELFPTEIAGTSVGAVNLFPFLGGAVMQPILGWVLDTYAARGVGADSLDAYRAVLLILLVMSLLSVVCALFMKETHPDSLQAGERRN